MSTGTDSTSLVGWAVDRKVPIAFFLALLVQTIGIGYWLGTLQTTLIVQQRTLDSIGQERVAERLAQVNGRIDTLISLAQQTDRQMDRLERRVQQLGERP